MDSWAPATEAEMAMRDVLRAGDQEQYFRILARIDLLLPVSADAAGRRSPGWGTWSSDGRTHVLAFTSSHAMRTCLAEHAGSYRSLTFRDLAESWPNQEWWLAVNPGLPIEGYLPAWFVAQISRGDVRLPGRSLGSRARMDHASSLRARAVAQVPGHPMPPVAGGPAVPAGAGPSVSASTSAAAAAPAPAPAPASAPVAASASAASAAPASAAPASAAAAPAQASGPAVPAGFRASAAPYAPAGMPRSVPAPAQAPGRDAPGREGPGRDFPRRDFPRREMPGRDGLDDPTREVRGRVARLAQVASQIPPASQVPVPPVPPMTQVAPGQVAPGQVPPVPGGPGQVPPTSTGRGRERAETAAPPTIDGEIVEPEPGLGARLAALQAVSGGFAVLPVEPPTETTPLRSRHPGTGTDRPRGLWEAKVPGTQPADPAAAEASELRAEAAWSAGPDPTDGDDLFAQPFGAYPAGERAAGAFARDEPAPHGPGWHEPGLHEPGRHEPAAHQPAPYEPGLHEPGRYEPAAHEPAPHEPARHEPAPHEPAGPAKPLFDVGNFEPANATEEDLLNAARAGNNDQFLSTLLLAKVLVPGDSAEPGRWPTEELSGGRYLVTFTSPERLAERRSAESAGADPARDELSGDELGGDELSGAPDRSAGDAATRTVTVRFTSLIISWPDDDLGFAVNPGSPVGAKLSADEVRTLASWALEVGLIGQPELEQMPAPAEPEPVGASRFAKPPETAPNQPLLMQKTIAADQLPFYLERGYDRVSGFVHRATEVAHLRTPGELYSALGLSHSGSRFSPDDAEVYVLRWAAHCPSLYRIPFGGQSEAGMHAMQGWVIERTPFRGNGFAPSETSDVIAEFKVDSTRLPHGAQLWHVTREGTERLIAMFDADVPLWRRIGDDDA